MENEFSQDPQNPHQIPPTPDQPAQEQYAPEQSVPEAPVVPQEKLSGIIGLVKKSWVIFKKRIGTLISIGFIGLLLTVVSAGVFMLIGIVFMPVVFALIGMTVGICAFLLFQLAFIIAVIDQSAGTIECYKRALSKFMPFLWIVTIISTIILGGAFLLLVPGIIFGIWSVFAGYIFIVEEAHGMSAFERSKYYVRGRWWGVFWRVTVVALISGILSALPVVGPFLSVLLMPFTVVFYYVLYEELKATRGELPFVPNPKFNKIAIAVGIIGMLYIPVLAILFGGPGFTKDLRALTTTVIRKFKPAPIPAGFELAEPEKKPEQMFMASVSAKDSSGCIYAVNRKENCVTKCNPSGNVIEKWACAGEADGQFVYPIALAVDSKNNFYIVEENKIQKFDAEGRLLAKWAAKLTGENPDFIVGGIEIDSSDNLYVIDTINNRVLKALVPLIRLSGDITAAIEKIPTTAMFFGTVSDKRKKPVAGVIISIVQNGAEKTKTFTDSEGIFSAAELPFGIYEIKLAKKGYKQIVKKVELTKDPAENRFVLSR